jgi:hypothetical protein
MPGIDEIKDWYEELLKTGSVDEEKRKVLDEVLAVPAVADYIKASVMRQSDYSRNQDALKAKEREIEAEKQNVATLQQQLVDYRGTNEKKYLDMVNELKASQTRQFQLEQGLRHTYGIDPATILGEGGGNGNGYQPVTDPNRIDPSSFLSKEEFNSALEKGVNTKIQGAATDLIAWTNKTYELNQRASELGIKGYTPGAVWDKMMETKNWNPDQIFDQLYNATAIQQQKQKEQYEADIAKARDEGIQRGRAEAALPVAQRANAPSLVQALIKGNEGQVADGPASVTSDKSHVARAADALRATMEGSTAGG